MPSSVANGTLSASGSEQTLATVTSGGSFVLVTDCSGLAGGDKVELRIYTKTKSGGVERLSYTRRYANAQAEPIKYSPPVPADVSFRATLNQVAGTLRAFDWSILQL